MKLTYNFYELLPGVFLAEIFDNHDLAMTFWRAQEFYESSNPKFQGGVFTQCEYMSWYAKKMSDIDTFTYSDDWCGFNLPSQVIEKCYELHTERNEYDRFFVGLNANIREYMQGKPYYLLGARKGDTDTLDHELAHGLFATNESYRQGMLELVKDLPKKKYARLCKLIHKMGYAKSVTDDEIQAYLATGLAWNMKKSEFHDLHEPFKKFFKHYCAKWTLPKPVLKKGVIDLKALV
jgi:hypothetical protein